MEEKKDKSSKKNINMGGRLFTLIIISVIILDVAGLAKTLNSGENVKITMKEPLFNSLFAEAGDEEETGNEFENDETEEYIPELPTEPPTQTTQPAKVTDAVTGDNNQTTTEPATTEAPTTGYKTEFVKIKKAKPRSPYYGDPGVKALNTDYPYKKVKDDYFDDAVFIGDSRIDGLRIYSNLKNATFYSKEGITIYKLLTEKIAEAKIDGKTKKVTVIKALKNKKFKKIYLMVGINELGYQTTEYFADKYRDVVDKLHRLQPDATIYIMGIMNVTTKYSNGDDVYNNDNINDKNVAIAKIADGKSVFYLDINPAFADKQGGIKKSYSWDGIHLQAEYYSMWVDFLKEHAVVEETTTEAESSETVIKETSPQNAEEKSTKGDSKVE